VKSFDTFDFTAIPSLKKPLTLQLARCEYVVARDNVNALGNSGTGKTHVSLALDLAARQRSFAISFHTAAELVQQLTEGRKTSAQASGPKEGAELPCALRAHAVL
jgi:DNA replication protein DnaC